MKLLLTGHEGFVGSNLLPILQKDHEVFCIDRKSGLDLVDCDLEYDVDAVIHLAGLSGVRDSMDKPHQYWMNNVLASTRLFAQFKDKKVIYASSSTAAEPELNPYALSKKTLEKLAPVNSIGLRFTTVYGGKNSRDNMLIPKILQNNVKFIHTNHSRDFVHVNDVCDAIIMCLHKNIKGVFDVGSGKSHKLLDIMNFCKIKGFEQKIGGPNERLDNKADIEVLGQHGWRPKIDLYDYLGERI